jgi:hypothetical protein
MFAETPHKILTRFGLLDVGARRPDGGLPPASETQISSSAAAKSAESGEPPIVRRRPRTARERVRRRQGIADSKTTIRKAFRSGACLSPEARSGDEPDKKSFSQLLRLFDNAAKER